MQSPNELPTPAERIVLASLDALKVYFDPLRQKIVQQVIKKPKTVHAIAEALDVPFTRLYYHINLLEKHNIIRVVDTRAMSGAVEEKYYQIAAYQFIVPRDMLTLGTPENEGGLNVFLAAMLDETADDIRHSVEAGTIDIEAESPHPESLLMRRGIVKMPPEKASEFHTELVALLKRYLTEEEHADDQYYGVTIAVYPSAYLTTLNDEADSTSEQDDN
ncbi:MAG: helix-turn-helix domain-containing protein [Chloroflexota bacterium]